MSNTNPNNSAIAAIRLLIQDRGTPPILHDNDYIYFLSLSNNNVRIAAQYAAQSILFSYSTLVTERIGELEIEGQHAAIAYREALKMFLSNPNFSVAMNTAMPYAGGISKQDVIDNLTNFDTISPSIDRSLQTQSQIFPSAYQEDNPFQRSLFPRSDPFGLA